MMTKPITYNVLFTLIAAQNRAFSSSYISPIRFEYWYLRSRLQSYPISIFRRMSTNWPTSIRTSLNCTWFFRVPYFFHWCHPSSLGRSLCVTWFFVAWDVTRNKSINRVVMKGCHMMTFEWECQVSEPYQSFIIFLYMNNMRSLINNNIIL